jgi:hypothetical protein
MMIASAGRPTRNRRSLWRMVILCVLSTVLFCDQAVSKRPTSAGAIEYDVKAAFLLNFTKYVDWPPTAFSAPDSPLTICILGTDPFGRVMDQLVEGELVNGRKIMVERIRPEQEKACQVLYTSGSRTVPAALNGGGVAILTVGEGADFIHQGGVIGFVVDNRRVRFDINLKAANSAGLKLSSKLLSVARSVER